MFYSLWSCNHFLSSWLVLSIHSEMITMQLSDCISYTWILLVLFASRQDQGHFAVYEFVTSFFHHDKSYWLILRWELYNQVSTCLYLEPCWLLCWWLGSKGFCSLWTYNPFFSSRSVCRLILRWELCNRETTCSILRTS